MPRALARSAAAVPIRPSPTTPNTRPRSRRNGTTWVYIHGPSPPRSRELSTAMPRVKASVIPIAVSATSSVP